MGHLTRAQIVARGLLQAGRTDITVGANTDFNTWLQSVYASFQWPFLRRRKEAIALASGVQSLSFGLGSNGEDLEVSEIKDPALLYDSTYSTSLRLPVISVDNPQIISDETLNNPVSFAGTPLRVKVMPDVTSWGKWNLIFTPFPNRNFYVALDYIVQPADIDDDDTVPLYPNDRTMIQAVKVDALNYMKKYEAYGIELQVLDALIEKDKLRYGQVKGNNDAMLLDSSVFR